MRHLANPDWCAAHSAQARWDEEQKNYRRLCASPDLCFRGDMIGYYGDKQWCLWLIDKMNGGGNFRVCGCTETALMFMANRYEQSWKNWANLHRGESQEEWIKDGFAQRGITVHLPPTLEDTLPLLGVLGHKTWNTLWAGPQGTNAPDAFPNYLQYNAFRWLRDSGFNQTAFAASNATTFTDDVVRIGLLQYTKWNAAYRIGDGVGVLAFGKAAHKERPFGPPLILKSWFQAVAWLLVIVPIVAGSSMLLGRKKRVVESSPGDGAPQ